MEIMNTQIAEQILDNNYTIEDAKRILPSEFNELLLSMGYDNIAKTEKYYIDTPDDINDLILLHLRDCIENTSYRWDMFWSHQDSVMASCSKMGFEEWEKTRSGWKGFKTMYPNLARTILVWGWS